MRRNVFVPLLPVALFVGLMAVFSPTVHSQPPESMLKMVFIQANSSVEVKKLIKMGIDIAAVRKPGTVQGQEPGYRVEAVVSSLDERKIGKAGFNWKDAPPLRASATRARQGESVYHSFDEPVYGIQAQLKQIAQRYPGLAALETIGYSLNKRPVLAVRLTAGAGLSKKNSFWKMGMHGDPGSRDKPQVLYLATHHAREWVATQMAMRLIKYLVENFGKSDRVSNLLLTTEIWIVPVANPDGYQYTFTHERLWRKNLRDNDGDGIITPNDGVDPNRNFDSHWGLDEEGAASITSDNTYRGTAPNSEPITQAVADFIMARNFKNVVSYHTSGNLILYAWGWQVKTPSLDDPIYVAQAGTDEKPAIWDSIMNQGYDPGVGADLYTVNGDFTDWCYEMGIPASTVELTWGYDQEGEYYGFEFPDDETMVQTVFEDNLNYALSIAESAGDMGHPVSPVGIVVEDVYHTAITDSWGQDQVVELLARKGTELKLSYGINGGAQESSTDFIEILGSRYNDHSGIYFSRYRAVIRGQAPGDSVAYSISGGTTTLGPHNYTVTSATGNPVLIISAEDYTGEEPVYGDQTGPNYLHYYTDALNAAGYGYDIYDVTAHAAAPSRTDVLSHYGVVIWYTGDNYNATVPYPSVHEDIFLNLREFMNYDNGKVLVTGQDIAYPSSYTSVFSDDFFQYYLGAYIHVEGGGMAGENIPHDVRGEEGDPVFNGLKFSLYGGDGANNQSHIDTFMLSSYFLPHFNHSIAASYDRLGGPFAPHSGEYYVYSQIADYSYKRFGGTFMLPDHAPKLTFWISYDLEPEWDYAFVEISEVGSDIWTTLPDLKGMTTQGTGDSCADGWVEQLHPFLANYMDAECNPTGSTGEWHGFSGSSGGWHQVEMDLSAYAGKTVELYITSASDWGTQYRGVFIDDIQVSGLPLEDFEIGTGPFSPDTAPESQAINNWIHMEGIDFPEGAALISPNSLYLGFGFEGIDTAANREEIMTRIMQHFMPQ